MKIAVTYENGQIFQHFGHTQQFKLYILRALRFMRQKERILSVQR